MGIGRREFLRLFGAALATLVRPASPAVALLGDLYINRKLGIAFRKPLGWHFGNVKEMGEVKNGQLLDLEDPGLARDLVQETELPLLSISREPISASSRTFTPGVNIYLDRFLADETRPPEVADDPLQTTEHDAEDCAEILKEFRMLSHPVPARVAGCPSAEYTASFLFEHTNLPQPVRVRMRTLLVVQIPAWYTLRMYDSPYLGGKDAFDYSEFVNSIQVV
jgi:hypothetical protein